MAFSGGPKGHHRGGGGGYLSMLVAPTAQAAGMAAPSPWAVSEAAGHGAIAGYLDGVTCAAAAHCVAVGSQVDTKGNAHALVETLNGAAWGHQGSPCRPAGLRRSSSELPARRPHGVPRVAITTAPGPSFPW